MFTIGLTTFVPSLSSFVAGCRSIPPQLISNRFGVVHYHHPDILEALNELSKEASHHYQRPLLGLFCNNLIISDLKRWRIWSILQKPTYAMISSVLFGKLKGKTYREVFGDSLLAEHVLRGGVRHAITKESA